jgi:signal transduction histidine kinase
LSPRAALTLGALARRLGSATDVPILAVRLPQLERLAWECGRGAARRLERRASRAFAQSAGRVLRAGDLLAHEPASDIFAAALAAKVRHPAVQPMDPGARTAIARIGAALEALLRLEVQTGWTSYDAARDARDVPALLQRALAHGALERERFAFFSALGHELRTPLASIRGYLETLLEDEAIDPHTRRRFTGIAYRESLRLSRLIEGMFEMSMLDLRPSAGAAARAQLANVFEAVRDATFGAARRTGAAVDVEPPGDVLVAIDPDRLILVLVNLIENALKHGRAQGHVRVRNLSCDGTARIVIDDDGPGVKPDEREGIFTLGVRGRTTAAGTGIGLALVRQLVERAGGFVAVGPSPLGGARFVVTLRCAQGVPATAVPSTCGVMKNSTSSLVCER